MVLLHLTSDMLCVSHLPVCTAGTANGLIDTKFKSDSYFKTLRLYVVFLMAVNEDRHLENSKSCESS